MRALMPLSLILVAIIISLFILKFEHGYAGTPQERSDLK